MSISDVEDEAGGAAAVGLFGLSGADTAELESFCSEALGDVGVDAGRFFARLKEGESVGSALGLPEAVGELIYARAYRWFMVDRPERAEPLFRALCAAYGKVADYWIGLGVCLRMKHDFKGAKLAFSVAARLRPDWAVPPFHSAELALQTRDHTAAGEQLARFRRLRDDTTPARMSAEGDRMAQALAIQTATKAPPARR